MECQYQQICKYYTNNCDDKNYQETCWVHTTLEGILKFEVFKSKINKRIYRSEHHHNQEESFRV